MLIFYKHFFVFLQSLNRLMYLHKWWKDEGARQLNRCQSLNRLMYLHTISVFGVYLPVSRVNPLIG